MSDNEEKKVSPRDLPRSTVDAGPLEWVDEHLTDGEALNNLNNNWDEDQYEGKAKNAQEAKEAREELQNSQERPKSGLSWWKKVANNIKYSVIAPETETAFLDIYELAKELLKGMGFRPIDITTSLMTLSTFHQNLSIHTELIVKDVELAKRLHRASQFACAAYGWKLLTFSQKSAKTFYDNAFAGEAANEKLLLELTGVKKEDIVVARWHTCKKFSPGHFIVLDHQDKAVVLCVRGTFHYRDCLTDLSAKYYPYKGGYAHYGILCAAKQLAQDVTPTLIEQLKKNPGYKLIVIGHSLGAGTASLLSTLLHDEYNIDLHCYALAPPCVLSLDLAAQCSSFITSVIVNDDIIPRLCWGSVNDLKECLVYLLNQKDGSLGRMFQILSAGNNLGETVTKKLSSFLRVSPTPDLGAKKFSERLYPPGTCYHIYRSSNAWGSKYDMMETSSPSMFSDIIISNTMFTDHMPDLYERAIKRTLDRIVKINDEEKVTEASLEQANVIPPAVGLVDATLPQKENDNNKESRPLANSDLIDLREPADHKS
mmetsp:Transcript_12466/g.17271  ORF Transcript_12466/g.17271 Transcript_12466/m.17271 type:complete len:540 (-) Transcript_12466:43-1662(-)